MSGPLAQVDTVLDGINADITRLLYWGPGVVLEFIIPDVSTIDNWQVVKTLTHGFDRITSLEKTSGDASDVFIQVSDLDGSLPTVLAYEGLAIRVDGDIFRVASTPGLAKNEATTYMIHCKTRALRARYTATVKR